MRTKQVHSSWCLERYPDVVWPSVDPPEHYVEYDAAMGRTPGKNFNTQAYLERDPVRAQLCYWHTVRFAADNEFIRSMQAKWDEEAVRHMPTGPLPFRGDFESVIVADDVLETNGGPFGLSRQYFESPGSTSYAATAREWPSQVHYEHGRCTGCDI